MSAPANIHINETGLVLEGVIDHQSVPSLLRALPSDVEFESPEIDLSKVTKIDSAGLAFIINWGNQILAKDQKIVLHGTNQKAAKLIEIMNLEAVFTLV